MPWIPSQPGEVPTLGWSIVDWMETFLAAPDRSSYEPFTPYDEQALFIAKFYEIDPSTEKRRIRRGAFSRPKGFGKSPLMAAFAAAEALAPVLFDHWAVKGEVSYWGYEYREGEPVGKPWADIRTPWVQIAAVSEDQTKNSWLPLLEMLKDGPAMDAFPGLEPLETFVNLPGGGRIEYVTSSATSREGNRPVFVVLDQTEEWRPSNGGVKLAAVLRRNLGKTGGSSIESPNAFLPGDGSVAEKSAEYWTNMLDGKTRDRGFLYDHREAPADTDMTDHDSLLEGLKYVYGDSATCNGGHVDLERIIAEIWDPDTDPQDARRFYLNQITHASDSFVSAFEWEACKDSDHPLVVGDLITLGFDGSRGKAKGKPDATALIGCRVSDGKVFEIGVWEAQDGPGEEDWTPPLPAIHDAVAYAFRTYKVCAFYADPAKDWRSIVNEWEAKYGSKVAKRVTNDHPFEWWMTGGRSVFIQRAIELFEGAVRNGDLKHNGDLRVTQHVLNARRRVRHQKLTLGKENDYSSRKIDACVAAVMAYQARTDCVAAGFGKRPTGKAPIRVR